MTTIDAWAQIPTPRFLEKLPQLKRLIMQSKSNPQFLGPSDTLKEMDKGGVKTSIICGWNKPDTVIISNEEVYEFVKHDPERFVGLASVDLNDPVKAVKEIDKCVNQYGFKGVRVIPWLWDKPLTTNLYYPIFVKCIELDIPFCCQIGHTGPLFPSDVGRPIPYIDQVALTFPQLKIVCGHIGYPWTNEAISCAWKHENVYIDTSAYLPRYYPQELVQFMNSNGQNKVLFGTNYPQLTWKACTDQIEELKLKKQAQEKFLYKNAETVFKLNKEIKSKF